MAQKLETIKGGGGSIRIGTAGTISSLMNRELEAPSSSSYTPSSSSRATPTAISVSVSCGHRSLKPRKSTDVASATSGHPGPITKLRSPETSRRTWPGSDPRTPERQKQKTSPLDEESSSSRRSPRRIHGRTRHAPMLGSENAAPDKTPNREKPLKKGINIVQVVDTSCGSPRASLSNRLRKLRFSKMSQSII